MRAPDALLAFAVVTALTTGTAGARQRLHAAPLPVPHRAIAALPAFSSSRAGGPVTGTHLSGLPGRIDAQPTRHGVAPSAFVVHGGAIGGAVFAQTGTLGGPARIHGGSIGGPVTISVRRR